MKVVAVADLHGRLPEIPPCDILVIAGDICPDSLSFRWGPIEPNLSRADQEYWLRHDYRAWENRIPAGRIMATPGNHDWVTKFPDECRSKMFIDETVEVAPNLHFYFTPWGASYECWNYNLGRKERRARFEMMPPHKFIDLLVMHTPAFGVGDLSYAKEPLGCREMRAVIQQRQPKRAVFGHIHEGQRFGKEYRLGGTKLYHVSMWGENWNPTVLEIF